VVGVANANVVAVLTRAPGSGGKTRLFDALGIAPDASLLEALLLDTLDGARCDGTEMVVVVTPASAIDDIEALVPGAAVIAQGDGTLGDRMRQTVQQLLDAGAQRVALIGSDLPDITSDLIASAFAALARDPDCVVLGPAVDGGYYLVAATKVPPIFDGIAWGTGAVLEQTRRRAESAGLRVHLLPPLGDVDTPPALRALRQRKPASRSAIWASSHLE
jgi:uncharacterized protein